MWGGGNIGISEMVNQMNFPNVQKYTGYVKNVIKWPNMIINDLRTELQLVGITHSFKMGEKEIIQ